MRDFASVFRRAIAGPFAGDAVPGAAQVVNVPSTGVGTLIRLPLARVDKPDKAVRFVQGYLKNVAGAFAGTFTLTLWINAALGTTPGDWIQVGPALAAVPLLTLFQSAGPIQDADAFIQVVPSVATLAGQDLELYLEGIEEA